MLARHNTRTAVHEGCIMVDHMCTRARTTQGCTTPRTTAQMSCGPPRHSQFRSYTTQTSPALNGAKAIKHLLALDVLKCLMPADQVPELPGMACAGCTNGHSEVTAL
eukprot:GHRQ01030431.1.p5 GENE.GHRQ01030431.1~~GHRQ01030431.1.p5  ORF type:complete len:107 (-),score=6.88 GHRQ01030431.1:1105-1425(-)